MQNEMSVASEVQRKLLPQHMPPLETLDYAGSCEPAWSVGGDYCDFLDLVEAEWVLCSPTSLARGFLPHC